MEDGGIFVRFGEREERKVRENEMKREKDMSQMKLVRVLNEVSLG